MELKHEFLIENFEIQAQFLGKMHFPQTLWKWIFKYTHGFLFYNSCFSMNLLKLQKKSSDLFYSFFIIDVIC